VLLAVTSGSLDAVELEDIDEAQDLIRRAVREDDAFRESLLGEKQLEEDVKQRFIDRIESLLQKELDI
jgi:F0F1-type ATP synthase alpha subunit